jgi:hypothetical protein
MGSQAILLNSTVIKKSEFTGIPGHGEGRQFSGFPAIHKSPCTITSKSSTRMKCLSFAGKLQFRLLLRRIYQTLPSTEAEQIRCDLAHLNLLTTFRDSVSTMMPPDVLKWVMP